MKTLLMIESWCFASGMLLPRAIRAQGHRYLLLTRCPELYAAHAPAGEAHPVLALAARVVRCDTNHDAALWAAVQALQAEFRIDGVISSCDHYLGSVARLARRLGLPGADPEAVLVAGNKHRTRQRLAAEDRPGPAYAVIGDVAHAELAAERIGYPLIVKPADASASSLVQRVDDVAMLWPAVAAVLEPCRNARGQLNYGLALLEAWLPGEEYSVEVCADNGHYHVLGVTDKVLGGGSGHVELGHMFPAALAPATAKLLIDEALTTLAALGYRHGMAHVELRLHDGKATLVEVNPRLGGNYIAELIMHTRGIDPMACMVQLALGESPRLQPHATGHGSAAIRFLLPERAGVLQAIHGAAQARQAAGVCRLQLDAQPGQVLRPAADNNGYLGHVLAVGGEGEAAALAARAVAMLRPQLAQ